MKTLVKPLLPLLIAGLVLVGCSDDDKNDSAGASVAPTSFATGITETQRQVLGESKSDRAPGQVVVLSRVVIPVGQELPPHTHPGPQLAVIEQGTLTYTIYKGSVQVTHAAGMPDAKVETVNAGQTIDLKAGDSIIEQPGMEHRAQNKGDVPIIIYLSSLFPEGAPASSPAPQ